MRIYVAGPYAKRLELQAVANRIAEEGHDVTSEWLWSDDRASESSKTAAADLIDINTSDVFLAMTEPPESNYSSGGRHFEAGWAYQLLVCGEAMKHLCFIGPRENVFYHLQSWRRCRDVDDFLAYLADVEAEASLREDKMG